MVRSRQIRSRTSFRGGPRKPTRWENLLFEVVVTAVASQDVFDLTPEPMATDLQGTATLKRMICHVDINPVVSAGMNTFLMGICVVTNDAFAAAAVPDPLTDAQQSWYYWTQRVYSAVNAAEARVSWDFDMRTMRKLRGGYKLIGVLQNPTNQSNQTVSLAFRNLWTVD